MQIIFNIFNSYIYSSSLRSWSVEWWSPNKDSQERSKFNAKAENVEELSCSDKPA